MKRPNGRRPNWFDLMPGSDSWLDRIRGAVECPHCCKNIEAPTIRSILDRGIEPCPHCGKPVDYPKMRERSAGREMPDWLGQMYSSLCEDMLKEPPWDPTSSGDQVLVGYIAHLMLLHMAHEIAADDAFFKTAVAEIEAASAAVRRAHTALMSIPEDRRDTAFLHVKGLLAISEILKTAASGAKAEREKFTQGDILPIMHNDGRPPNRLLKFRIEIAIILWVKTRGRLPTVTYDPDTGLYGGEFIRLVLPMVSQYHPNEKACARAIARTIKSHRSDGRNSVIFSLKAF